MRKKYISEIFKSKRGMSFINKAGAPDRRRTTDLSGHLAEKGQSVIGPHVAFQKVKEKHTGPKKKKSIETIKFFTKKFT